MTSDATILADILEACHGDPVLFNDVVLDRPPYWDKQEEICDSVAQYGTTIVVAGNEVGKSYAVGGIIPWWTYTRPGSLGIVTAPSQVLVGTVVFKEVRKAIKGARFPLPGKLTDSPLASPQRLAVDNTGHEVIGFATTGVERLSGQHNPHLLIVVEEASGVSPEIWEALDSQDPEKMLIIGNPIRPDGRFRELAELADQQAKDPSIPDSSRINKIHIPTTMSPDIHLDRSPRGLASKIFIDKMRRQYGENSMWWRTHILALFPEIAADTLIPDEWLDLASASPVDVPNRSMRGGKRRISCDLGEGVGRDRSAIICRDDLGVLEVEATNTAGLPEAAAIINRMRLRWGVDQQRITYDKLGIGKNFPNHLYRHGITTPVPYAGSGSPRSKKDFANLRSEAAWKLRRRLDPNWCPDPDSPRIVQAPFSIPPEAWWPSMREELAALSYELVGTQTKLLGKQEWADKLGRSPDLADALIQSFAFV